MFKKLFIVFLIFVGTISFAQSDTSWIKKKDKSEKTEKVNKVEKKNSSWIKKKIKENKKEYKKEEKKITKEVNAWIKKKTKDNYISNIEDLPKDASLYFTAKSLTGNTSIYGYVFPDVNSKFINGYNETNKGLGFLNDGKTTCKVGLTVFKNEGIISRVSGRCSNGLKFNSTFSLDGSSASGVANTADGKDRYLLDVKTKLIEIANLYKENNLIEKFAKTKEPQEIELKPIGKYHALLIGNSNYPKKGKFTKLTSPKNDVTELSKILETKYNFNVISELDVTRNKFFDLMNELKNKTKDSDYVLIYYSGHGERVGNERYWIPIDASKNNRRNWINVSDITASFEGDIPEIASTHIALIVDSCWFKVKGQDNVRNKKMAYNKLLKSRTAVVMASGQDTLVDDPEEGSSLFAKSIINQLENTDQPIRLHDIYIEVFEQLGELDQTPIYRTMDSWSHKDGDFIFIPKNKS